MKPHVHSRVVTCSIANLHEIYKKFMRHSRDPECRITIHVLHIENMKSEIPL